MWIGRNEQNGATWLRGTSGTRKLELVLFEGDRHISGCGVGPESGRDPNMAYLDSKTPEQVREAVARWRGFFAIEVARNPEGRSRHSSCWQAPRCSTA